MTGKKDKAEKTKSLLLAVGLELFSERGFDATRLEDIAVKAHVTRGAIYWHFQDKHDFFCQLLKSMNEKAVSRLLPLIKNNKPPLVKLQNLIMAFSRQNMIQEDYRIISILSLNFSLSAEFEKEKCPPCLTIKEFLTQTIYDLLIQARQRGEMRHDIQFDMVYEYILTLVFGLIATFVTVDKIMDQQYLHTITEKLLGHIKT